MASYRRSFRIHILPDWGALQLDEIARDRVKQFVSTLVQKRTRIRKIEKAKNENGTVVERKVTYIERPLSKSSIWIILAALCIVLNHALEDRHIMTNPAARLGKYYKQTKNLHEETQPLSHQEVPVFLGVAAQHYSEDYPLFLAIHTGMRAGELIYIRSFDSQRPAYYAYASVEHEVMAELPWRASCSRTRSIKDECG
jgi:integrase